MNLQYLFLRPLPHTTHSLFGSVTYDTGLAMHLQGLNSWDDACRLGRDSFFVENNIAIELKSYFSIYEPAAKLRFWWSSGGAEIVF